MRNLNEENLTQAVIEKLSDVKDPRFKQVMTSLVSHLHDFVRDVELTPEEWFAGIEFLTQTGQKCDEQRQEFILLSDVLGISMLVDAINNRKPEGATQSSVLGPFYTEGAPEKDSGTDLAPNEGPGVIVSGKVTGVDGQPIAGACLDIWQTDPNGLYHMQDEEQEEHHLCGKVISDAEGNYSFRTLVPVSYSVPTDGPVGLLLNALERHAFRPAHIHFIVTSEGYKPLVTQLFSEGDKYLESDVVFGVKDSLVVEYMPTANEWVVNYDFILELEK